MRYIDADALAENIRLVYCKDCNNYHEIRCRCCGIDDALSMLEDAPTADVVEVRHAYWKETTHITESKRGREIHSKLYNCSYCDAPNGRKKSSYCHWCGAKMDGERIKNGD